MQDQNTMPGAFPGASPSFENDDPTHSHVDNPSSDERHVHFENSPPPDHDHGPPRDISQDREEVVYMPVPDPEVPQPGQGQSDLNGGQQASHPPVSHQGTHEDSFVQNGSPPTNQNYHQAPPPHRQVRPDQPLPPSVQHRPPPEPPIQIQYPLARPVGPSDFVQTPVPAHGPYIHPQTPGPYDGMSTPPGPWLQDPGLGMPQDPFGGPPPWVPPPRHAEFHHTHQQVRRRARRPPPFPLGMAPPRQQRQPVQIQVQEQQVPQIQVQHIPAQNNNNGNGNGNVMGDAMQMMMMSQMMSQQMNAQQMQAAQFGAMMNGVNGGGGRNEANAQATCGGGPGGVNVHNCQNQAIGGRGDTRRRRRIRKRGPRTKAGLKIQVGGGKRLGVPPPPRINAPLPPPPVDALVSDNWQEATIILCLAVVALIYLVASRAGGEAEKNKDPTGSSVMSRPAK